MVLRSQRDSLGSSSQAPRDCTSGTRGDIDVPAVGQHSGAQGPDSKGRASRSGVWVCGATLTWLHGWAGGRERRHRVLGPDPAAHWRRERGMGMWRRGLAHCHPRPLGTRRKRKLLLWSFGYRTKILHPALFRGKEWCYRHLLKSRIQRLRVARPRDGRLPWHFTGLAGAEAGCAAFLRPAPCCGRCEGCCCGRARAEVEAAGGRLRRRAGGGAAAGGGGGDSSGPPGQDVMKRLRLLLCSGELLGKVLHRFAE